MLPKTTARLLYTPSALPSWLLFVIAACCSGAQRVLVGLILLLAFSFWLKRMGRQPLERALTNRLFIQSTSVLA